MNALQDRDPMDEAPQRHNCEEWRYDGIGCARCNPVVVGREFDSVRELLREAEGENVRLREAVAALERALEPFLRIVEGHRGYFEETDLTRPVSIVNLPGADTWYQHKEDGFLTGGALLNVLRVADTDWRKDEAKAAYEQGLRDT